MTKEGVQKLKTQSKVAIYPEKLRVLRKPNFSFSVFFPFESSPDALERLDHV
jgi:hypothetical protein